MHIVSCFVNPAAAVRHKVWCKISFDRVRLGEMAIAPLHSCYLALRGLPSPRQARGGEQSPGPLWACVCSPLDRQDAINELFKCVLRVVGNENGGLVLTAALKRCRISLLVQSSFMSKSRGSFQFLPAWSLRATVGQVSQRTSWNHTRASCRGDAPLMSSLPGVSTRSSSKAPWRTRQQPCYQVSSRQALLPNPVFLRNFVDPKHPFFLIR